VISKLGADHPGYFTLTHPDHRFFKGLHHLAGAKPPKVAPLGLAGTGGKLLRQGIETATAFQLLQNLFGQTLLFHQYMTRSPFHRQNITGPVLFGEERPVPQASFVDVPGVCRYTCFMAFRRPPSLSGFSLLALSLPSSELPYLAVLQELHAWLESQGVIYAVIGGVAVVRSGSARTTGDIDILVRRDEWSALRSTPTIRKGPDWAEYIPQQVPVDVLFAGDDWDLPFLLPDPETVREWDAGIGVWFMASSRLLELKGAVYIAKNREFGAATAAKDLADVYSLMYGHPELRSEGVISTVHPAVQDVIRSVAREITSRPDSDGAPKR
jgi:hypothetical protein